MAEKNISKTTELVYNEEKREQYVESFRLANNDPEMIELAEEGLDGFAEMVERYEHNIITKIKKSSI